MYQPLPSTFGAALAIMGKKSERPVGRDLTLSRESEHRIVLIYGREQVIAYNAENGSPASIELALGDNRTSAVRSLANQALSATGVVIAEETAKERELLERRGIPVDATEPWTVFAPATRGTPYKDGMTFPVL